MKGTEILLSFQESKVLEVRISKTWMKLNALANSIHSHCLIWLQNSHLCMKADDSQFPILSLIIYEKFCSKCLQNHVPY